MSKNILVKFAWSVMGRTRQSQQMNFKTRDHFEKENSFGESQYDCDI